MSQAVSTTQPREFTRTAELLGPVNKTAEALATALLGRQHEQGFWCFELECDATPTADYILLWHYLSHKVQPAEKTAAEPRVRKAANQLLSKQNADGSWSIYHGGPGDISATVKVFFALKLAGCTAVDPRMQRAADFIRDNGGVQATNSFMKFYLAMFGQWPWERVPAMPPELVLLPTSFPFHIYSMSSWSRAIVVPMFILYALRPRIDIPADMGISELTVAGNRISRKLSEQLSFAGLQKTDPWSKFFYRVDFFLKGLERNSIKPWRNSALTRCRDWILERMPMGQGLGSIWPAMINAHMALACMEFPCKQRILENSLKEIEGLVIEEQDTLRVQPCWSAVWDTAITILALRSAGLAADDERLKRAGRWLLSKEVRIAGDWRQENAVGPTGGWYFQFKNDMYPDTDDTAMVLLALNAINLGTEKDGAMDRAKRWLLSMQNEDGGWGAFDKNNNRAFLTKVPFADHNAMIDPSSCDVTGRILEALGALGNVPRAAIGKAFAYLRRHQEADGTWFGRWGVNYIYGTWAVSNGMRAWKGNVNGLDLSDALQWLRERQNPDGGWGESCASYDDVRCKGKGNSTASQTAWALNTFFNANVFEDAAVAKGIAYLNRNVNSPGTIREDEFTGTGFPRVFYLNYHVYRLAFPLVALARYRDHVLSRQIVHSL